MLKREELDNFLVKAGEFIDSQYILADVKIVNLLKTIATSPTLLALFKNCLTDFDYESAKKQYLIKSPFAQDKGEFIMPKTSRELLAFIFNVLVDIDAGNINLSEFLDKYFYIDGSAYSAYSSFLNAMIKPFRNSVKMLMESVIDGKLQDPVEAFNEEETKRIREENLKAEEEKREKERSQKVYAESLKALRTLLLEDKKKVKESKLNEKEKYDLTLIIDMLANVLDSSDKDAIEYAFVSYRYAIKAHKILFFGRNKKVSKLVKDISNEL